MSVVDNSDGFAEFFGFFHIMSGQKNGFAFLVKQSQLIPDKKFEFQITAGGRFVQNKNLRVMNECAAEQETFFHSSGQGAVFFMLFVQQAESFEKFPGFLSGFAGRDPKVACLVNQHLENAQERVEVEFLGAQSDQLAGLAIVPGDIVSENTNFSGIIIRESGDHIDGCSFSGAIRAKESKEIPPFDSEGDIFQGFECFVGFAQIMNGNSVSGITHARLLQKGRRIRQ